jgi:hypothetical protein
MYIEELKEIRSVVADLIYSAGCSCCRDSDGWEDAQKRLAKLLKVPKYKDGSGYDFYRFSPLKLTTTTPSGK